MSRPVPPTSERIATFRRLHESGCFVLPNPWDVGSAVYLQRLGFKALATSSAGFAFTGASDPDVISTIVKEVSPKPVNVLVSKPSREVTVSRLADLGVRRVSVGSALARVAWGAFMRAARSIAETGGFDTFDGAASFAELNAIFDARR